MKIVAMIPIKLESKRFPGKNIKPFFDGTPLMHFIQKACLSSQKIDRVYVYCSNENIQRYTLPGVEFLERPSFLDNDDRNANDIIAEFIKTVDADIYVNAHATSPFAQSKTIDACIDKIVYEGYDSAFCAEAIRTFMWGNGIPINFDLDRFPRTQDLPLIYGETSIAYVFRKEVFLSYHRRVGIKPHIQEVGKIEALDIDYPEDFDIANAVYREVICK